MGFKTASIDAVLFFWGEVMTKKIFSLLVMISLLASCKVVNTHVVKITNTPVLDDAAEIQLKTTKGDVYLASQSVSESGREMLRGMRPYECVAITTSEPFDMENRAVHFTEFKMKKLMISDSECRKIKTTNKIYGN